MKTLRLTTFSVTLLVSLAIVFWPPLLYQAGQAPSHGLTSLLMLGLCVGIVYGSGILNKLPRQWLLIAALITWAALGTIGWMAILAF